MTNTENGRLSDIKTGCLKAQTSLFARFNPDNRLPVSKAPGTVMVCAVLKGNQLELRRAGDARGYLIRNDYPFIQTDDDTDNEGRPKSSISAIRESLGCLDFDAGDSKPLQAGDLLILRSDGTYRAAAWHELLMIMEGEMDRGGSDDEIAERIQTKVLEAQKFKGVKDNFSFITYCHGMSLREYFKKRAKDREKRMRSGSGISQAVAGVLGELGGALHQVRGTALAAMSAIVVLGGAIWHCSGGTEKNPFEESCAHNSINGKWTAATANPNDKEKDLSWEGLPTTVNIDVVSKGVPVVTLNDYPVACLNGGFAPAAVAAEHPSGNDLVRLSSGSGKPIEAHFTPERGASNALQKNVNLHDDLIFEKNGVIWLACKNPVSVGCKNDYDRLLDAHN